MGFISPVPIGTPISSFGNIGDGVTYSLPPGSPVQNSKSGKIKKITTSSDGTQVITIEHDGGFISKFSGVNVDNLKPGENINVGDKLGTSGSNVSLSMYNSDGRPIDPSKYFN